MASYSDIVTAKRWPFGDLTPMIQSWLNQIAPYCLCGKCGSQVEAVDLCLNPIIGHAGITAFCHGATDFARIPLTAIERGDWLPFTAFRVLAPAERFSAVQSRRGTRGNAIRWAGHVPLSTLKPWEAAGISRASWYARKYIDA
jgi:hypothetical protein